MQTYHWFVVILSFVVDFLLLYGGGRLSGDPAGPFRCSLGAATGALHSGLCMLKPLHFLGNPLWRWASIVGMTLIAYGLQRSTLRRGAIFVILNLALQGIAQGFGDRKLLSLLSAAAGLGLLCLLGFREGGFGGKFIPVKICCDDVCLQLKALQDTGNTLRDPVTGRPVLVIGAEAAKKLTGLTREQLQRPVEAIGALPGLRLIPYQAIGTESGLMLARKYQNVQIGKWRGSQLVAFAPESLSGDYEALTGGTV